MAQMISKRSNRARLVKFALRDGGRPVKRSWNFPVVRRSVTDAIGRNKRQVQDRAMRIAAWLRHSSSRSWWRCNSMSKRSQAQRCAPTLRRAHVQHPRRHASVRRPEGPHRLRSGRREAFGILGKIVRTRRASGFRRLLHFELRNQLAKILIALAGRAEQWKPHRFVRMLVRQPRRWFHTSAKIRYRYLSAHMRSDIVQFCAGVHPCRAVDTVVDRAGQWPASPARPRVRQDLRAGKRPEEKLKALAAWSSMYCSVIQRHHLPLVAHNRLVRYSRKASVRSQCALLCPTVHRPTALSSTIRRWSPTGHMRVLPDRKPAGK